MHPMPKNLKIFSSIIIACILISSAYHVIKRIINSSLYWFDELYSVRISSWPRILADDNNMSGIKFRLKFQSQREKFGTKLFITAFPNHGAGVGHQFDEWIQGLWAAYMYNITYVFTPFLEASAHWNKFLYFDLNEIVEGDVIQHFKTVNVKDYYTNNSFNLSAKSWIIQQQEAFQGQTRTDQAVVLRLHTLGNLVYVKQAACFTPINIQLRMKYCAARLMAPVRIDFYRKDRYLNRFIVAIHLRCGDSCYDSYRATPLLSIENTILQIHLFISQYYPTREAVFHLFSQSPVNSTAKKHFQQIIHNEKFRKIRPYPVRIVSHFSLSDPITLHHLIMSDVLLTAQSGFSLLAAVLRVGVTFGPMTTCQSKLTIHDYDKNSGNFSQNELMQALNYSETTQSIAHTAKNFNPPSLEHCLIYEKYKDIW